VRIEPGTRAVVTGASRGIGRALSIELARRGARLGLMARGKQALDELAAELPPSPDGPHEAAVADVSKRGETVRAIDRLAKRLDGIDLLVRIRGRAAAPRLG
jgi:NAD(P)-dependent dehydrogenase (short-subunit alcohol dehydrogenase family)